MRNLQSEETRSRILKRAGEQFAQKGYDRVGVVRLPAGGVKRAFYHFESKQAILMELLEVWRLLEEVARVTIIRWRPGVAA